MHACEDFFLWFFIPNSNITFSHRPRLITSEGNFNNEILAQLNFWAWILYVLHSTNKSVYQIPGNSTEDIASTIWIATSNNIFITTEKRNILNINVKMILKKKKVCFCIKLYCRLCNMIIYSIKCFKCFIPNTRDKSPNN